MSKVVMCCFVVSFPLFGLVLMPRVGAARLAEGAAAALATCAVPAVLLILHGGMVGMAVGQMAMAFTVAAYGSCLPILLTSTLPPEVRYSGVGAAYNVTQVFLGGLGPVTATALMWIHPVLPVRLGILSTKHIP